MAFLYVFCAEYGIPEFIALTIIVNCLIGIKTPSAEMESGKQFLTVSGHFVSRNNSGIGARIHLRKGETVTPENRFPLCGVIRFIGTASVGVCGDELIYPDKRRSVLIEISGELCKALFQSGNGVFRKVCTSHISYLKIRFLFPQTATSIRIHRRMPPQALSVFVHARYHKVS